MHGISYHRFVPQHADWCTVPVWQVHTWTNRVPRMGLTMAFAYLRLWLANRTSCRGRSNVLKAEQRRISTLTSAASNANVLRQDLHHSHHHDIHQSLLHSLRRKAAARCLLKALRDTVSSWSRQTRSSVGKLQGILIIIVTCTVVSVGVTVTFAVTINVAFAGIQLFFFRDNYRMSILEYEILL